LVAVNEREVRVADYASERARRLVDREFNVSYTAQLPTHNPLVAGAWREGETGAASVEQGIAETLGLKLGDVLRFDMGGVTHDARITSLRKVDWASMRANFFVLFPQQEMPSLPTTWLAAFHTPEGAGGFERAMLQRFPNVTSVDLRSSLAQVQRVLDQVTRAVEYLFAFTLAAGVLVLVAAVGAGRQARERDYAILRALGASRALLAQMQRAELLGLGALAGAMSGAVALALGWALTRHVLEFAWTPPAWVPLAAALAGSLLAWAAGSLSLAGVLRQPVVQTLRRVAE
jgi:putative ABC transport system permease protein